MAARSFALDLVQLTYSQWRAVYPWQEMPEAQFYKLRTEIMKAPHSTVLAKASGDAPAALTLGDVIVTGFSFAISGTNANAVIQVRNGSTSMFTVELSTASGALPSSITVRDIELVATNVQASTTAGSPLLFAAVYGYTPPTTNP